MIAAGHGLEVDPINAISTALRLCQEKMMAAGVSSALRFSAVLMDGDCVHAFRWSSDDKPPTLYWRGLDEGIALSSEPFSFDCDPWCAVPPNTSVTIRAGKMTTQAFFLP